MRLSLAPRAEPNRAMVYLSPVIAVALSLLFDAVLFAALGRNPLVALHTLIISPIDSVYGLSELALKAVPLLLIALGLAIGFRANVWNIGAEGQFTMGAIAGGGVALAVGGHGQIWVLPLMAAAGMAGGLLWAAIPAFLRTRFNAHEILTSLMLDYVALNILGYLVHGPWRDPHGFNFPQTRMFGPDAMLPPLIPHTRLHVGALAALAMVPLAAVLMRRTMAGFRLRVVGLAPGAARYAGFSANGAIWFTLLLSGALAGLAGLFEVAGPIGQLTPVISPGYGFAAIIVAFLGRLDPLGILFASLLVALIYLGGDQLQMAMQIPLAATGVMQGMMLFFLLACDVLILYRPRLAARREAPRHA